MSNPFVFLSPVAGETLEVGSIVKISWSGGTALPQRVVLSLVNINKFAVVGTGISADYLNNSSIGVFDYTVPTNFFQLNAAGSPADSFQFYIQDLAQTTWTYGPKISIVATNAFILKLFQVPVSFATNEASNLQSALDDVLPVADQIRATAQQSSDPGHAEIGAAAAQLAKALGKSQSSEDVLSAAKNILDKVVQRASSLGASAAQIKTKIEEVLPAIQQMVDSWTRVHDGPSLNKALDDTTSAVNLIAGLFAALGVALTVLGVPLGAVLTVVSLKVIAAATATDAVATEAVGLIDPATQETGTGTGDTGTGGTGTGDTGTGDTGTGDTGTGDTGTGDTGTGDTGTGDTGTGDTGTGDTGTGDTGTGDTGTGDTGTGDTGTGDSGTGDTGGDTGGGTGGDTGGGTGGGTGTHEEIVNSGSEVAPVDDDEFEGGLGLGTGLPKR